MKYAWIIDKDHLAPATGGDVGTVGPQDATHVLVRRLHAGEGRPFKMYDDDVELYYDGRIVFDGADDDLPEEAFGPLWDFGAPNAGCTEIRYRDASGRWGTL